MLEQFKKILTRQNQKGATMVDYMMLTAAVAGIGVPVMMRFFAGPINNSLLSKRQNLVSFLAQDRKEKIPNEWFGREGQPDLKEPSKLANVKNFEDPSVGEPGKLEEPGKLSNPNVRNPSRLAEVRMRDPGKLADPGQVSVGGGGGGGGGGGAGGGGGGNSNDFFAGGGENNKAGGNKNGPEGVTGATYGQASGKAGRGAGGGGDEGDAGEGAKGAGKDHQDSQKDSSGPGEAKKKQLEDLHKAEEELEARHNRFDWWMLIKILIAVLIAFLILLIVLGNMRRG
jgi:hypothetical protein